MNEKKKRADNQKKFRLKYIPKCDYGRAQLQVRIPLFTPERNAKDIRNIPSERATDWRAKRKDPKKKRQKLNIRREKTTIKTQTKK